MIHRGLFALAIVLGVSGGLRDGFERWIDTTDVPPLGSEVSTQVLDRNGELLRAYPVETGIWRLATTPKDVDPSFLQMLMTAEDKRFADHSGVDFKPGRQWVFQHQTGGDILKRRDG